MQIKKWLVTSLASVTRDVSFLLPASAEPSTLSSTNVVPAVTVAANNCHLPTSAGPGSGYADFHSDCGLCATEAANRIRNRTNSHDWYCTDNPTNNHTGLHYGCDRSSGRRPVTGKSRYRTGAWV